MVIKRRDSDNIEDEYKMFAGPHGRRIVTRLNKYMDRCFMLWCLCGAQFMVNVWLAYSYIIK